MITLRYSDTLLSSLTYDAEATNQREFDPVKILPPYPMQKKVSGIMLNGRQYNHISHTHLRFDFTISADELYEWDDMITSHGILSDSMDFLRKFLTARCKYISHPSEEDYIEVVNPDDIDVSYVDDIIYLPEFHIVLLTANAVTTEQMEALSLIPLAL